MKLRDYLDRECLTLEQFAARTGLHVSTVSRIAAGKNPPSPELVQRIREATRGEVTPNDLFEPPAGAVGHRELAPAGQEAA